MPTYEYVCDACAHELEEFQAITAKPLKKCPECGKSKLRRLIGTGAGFIFKGSGFYETDYRSEGYKNDQKADTKGTDGDKAKPSDSKSEPSKASGKDASKGEAKPAAKDAAKPAKPAKKPGGDTKSG